MKKKLQLTPQKYKGSWDYYEQVYVNKMVSLEEMDKFLDRYNLERLNQGKIENMNRWITSAEIETVFNNKQKAQTWWLHRYILSTISRRPFLLELFQKISEEWKLSNSFSEATITQMLKPDKDNTKQKKKGRRKLLILITEEHRCKNSQQNTSNPNSIH